MGYLWCETHTYYVWDTYGCMSYIHKMVEDVYLRQLAKLLHFILFYFRCTDHTGHSKRAATLIGAHLFEGDSGTLSQ